MHISKTLLRLALPAVLCASAQAGPMGFKDSAMAMGDFSPNWREGWVNYALTPRDALGAGGLWMRSDDKRLRREFAEVTYTRLVKRWNAEHSQANVWFVGGVGPLRGNDFSGTRTMFAPLRPRVFTYRPQRACTAPPTSTTILLRFAPGFRFTRWTTTKCSPG
jgi:hypothetical protein